MTYYAYGTGGRLTKITDALGNQTNFTYKLAVPRHLDITYVTDTVHQTGPTTTYGYHPNVAGSCSAAPSGDTLGGYTLAAQRHQPSPHHPTAMTFKGWYSKRSNSRHHTNSTASYNAVRPVATSDERVLSNND